jgi:hypothetical protein
MKIVSVIRAIKSFNQTNSSLEMPFNFVSHWDQIDERNQIDQINQTDQINQIDQMDQRKK